MNFKNITNCALHLLNRAWSSLKEKKNQQIAHPAMISILAQERLLGATLGAVFGGGVVFHQRRQIYKSLRENDSSSYEPVKITSEKTSLNVAHAWNKGVDLTLGRFVEFLSSRGW
ncbi:hypothetical protein LUZ60_016514 [Juncus effusus]|nr:hypothetical protein LUZ60_016514 [Juncus effusus]